MGASRESGSCERTPSLGQVGVPRFGHPGAGAHEGGAGANRLHGAPWWRAGAAGSAAVLTPPAMLPTLQVSHYPGADVHHSAAWRGTQPPPQDLVVQRKAGAPGGEEGTQPTRWHGSQLLRALGSGWTTTGGREGAGSLLAEAIKGWGPNSGWGYGPCNKWQGRGSGEACLGQAGDRLAPPRVGAGPQSPERVLNVTIPSWASRAKQWASWDLGSSGRGWHPSLSQTFWWDTGQRRAEGREKQTRSPQHKEG